MPTIPDGLLSIGGLLYHPGSMFGGGGNGNDNQNNKSTCQPNTPGMEQVRHHTSTPPRVVETKDCAYPRLQKFYEWEQFLDWVDWRDHPSRRRSMQPESELYFAPTLTPDFDAAMRLARFGWHDYDRFSSDITEMPLVQFSPIDHISHRYDIAGGAVNIGRYLAGAPDHMRRMEITNQFSLPARSIKIMVHGSFTWATDIRHTIQCGYNIYKLINTLEMANIRTEVIYTTVSDCVFGNNRKKYGTYETYVTIKRPQAPLYPEKLLFALAHPSFLRRLVFSEHERNPSDIRKKFHFYYTKYHGGDSELFNCGRRFADETHPAAADPSVFFIELVNFTNDADVISETNARLSRLFAEQSAKRR